MHAVLYYHPRTHLPATPTASEAMLIKNLIPDLLVFCKKEAQTSCYVWGFFGRIGFPDCDLFLFIYFPLPYRM